MPHLDARGAVRRPCADRQGKLPAGETQRVAVLVQQKETRGARREPIVREELRDLPRRPAAQAGDDAGSRAGVLGHRLADRLAHEILALHHELADVHRQLVRDGAERRIALGRAVVHVVHDHVVARIAERLGVRLAPQRRAHQLGRQVRFGVILGEA